MWFQQKGRASRSFSTVVNPDTRVPGTGARLLLFSTLLGIGLNGTAGDFLPQLKAHDKPHPFPIMPLYDLQDMGGEMPYVQDRVSTPVGVLQSIVDSTRSTRVGSSYNGATDGRETFADFRIKLPLFFMRAIATNEEADDYEDGAGNTQRYGYDRNTLQLALGATPNADREIKLVYVNDSIDDHKTPTATPVAHVGSGGPFNVIEGYGQDPVETEREVMKLFWNERFGHAVVKSLGAELYGIGLDRRANNFDLRNTPSAQYNEAIVDRTMEGLKLDNELAFAGQRLTLGLDYQQIRHDAQRYGGPGVPGGLAAISAYQYPGVELDELELTGVSRIPLAEAQTLSLGLAWKHVDASATKAGLAATLSGGASNSSQALYQTYYGAGVQLDQDEGHWSGKAQWDFQPEQGDTSAYASLGHFYRSPDTQERYFAAQSFNALYASPMGTSVRAVGNPEIDWELHRRLEAGVTRKGDNWLAYGRKSGSGVPWQLKASAFYDDVEDFISRDRAHGQTVTGVNDNARIWRNVDATLYGIELDLQANLTRRLATRINLQATRGENRSDNRDLYGIAPLELNWFLDYSGYLKTGGTWSLGGRVRHVASHDDVDDDPATGSGYDAGATDSFTTLDLYGSLQWRDRVGFRLGINNVTDELYTEADADFPMEGIPYLVNAPGRHLYIGVVANF
jgi:iron complex outermembrane receptor protein